jgi:hypothetical protein
MVPLRAVYQVGSALSYKSANIRGGEHALLVILTAQVVD